MQRSPVSTEMGDRSEEPQPPSPGIGCLQALHSGRAWHSYGKRTSDVTARTALSQSMHVVGQTLKGIHTECLTAGIWFLARWGEGLCYVVCILHCLIVLWFLVCVNMSVDFVLIHIVV